MRNRFIISLIFAEVVAMGACLAYSRWEGAIFFLLLAAMTKKEMET